MDSRSLIELMTDYCLDKTNYRSGYHNYGPSYTRLFEPRRLDVKAILEIGIGVHHYRGDDRYRSGNSLRCWRDYFPNAHVYGVDIDEAKMEGEDRISTFIGDQSKREDLLKVIHAVCSSGNTLDIIIDDGSHIADHQVLTFEMLSPYVSKHGIYVIEDVKKDDQQGFRDLSIFSTQTQVYITSTFDVECIEATPQSDDFLVVFTKKS